MAQGNDREVNGRERTGAYLVLLPEDDIAAGVQMIERETHIAMHDVRSPDGSVDAHALREADGVVIEELGVAILRSPPPQAMKVLGEAAGRSAVLAVEPERLMHALVAPEPAGLGDGANDYLRGYRDAVSHLADKLTASNGAAVRSTVRQSDESAHTWGLQAIRAIGSTYTGHGVRVAVLDTGFDSTHPDFEGRLITSASFIPGESPMDGHGHGTHCIGSACGPRNPATPPGYGVAHRSEIYVGKVLSNQGSGPDRSILAGIAWAVRNRCGVISMSLGSSVEPGEGPSPVYEAVARRAMRRGTLIIAAAGNESARADGVIAPVGRPANCLNIMAVAAVDEQRRVADFSCGGINAGGGEVNIAAPGDNVYSSYRMPLRHRRLRGTSMATPHVAGVAALLFEKHVGATPRRVWDLLVQNSLTIDAPDTDVGSGLVQAP